MGENDSSQDHIIYHVNETLKENTKVIAAMREDLGEVKIDVAVIKSRNAALPSKARDVKMTGLAGTIGGTLTAFLFGVGSVVVEYFKTKT